MFYIYIYFLDYKSGAHAEECCVHAFLNNIL